MAQEENYIQDFIEIGDKFQSISFTEYVTKYINVESSGQFIPFSFEGHEPLRELYSDPLVPRITIRKAAQLGVSVYAICRSLYLGERLKLSSGYLLPTDGDTEDFVNGKYDKLIKNSDHLSKLVMTTDTDNKGLKVFPDFNLFFRGVESKKNVKSFTADHIIKDEVDEANPENLAFADDRVLHSKYKLITELSQPSIDNYGIDAAFNISDQRFFGVKCTKCRTWNFVDETFPDCIMKRKDTTYYGCIKCTKKLEMSTGIWVPKFPDISKFHKGYHKSHLIYDVIKPDAILRKYKNLQTSLERRNFNISILGRPDSNKNNRPITLKVLKEAERDYAPMPTFTNQGSFFGMDVGDICHLVFGHIYDGILRVHYFCEMPSDNEGDEKAIIDLMRKHNVIRGSIDAMPYKTFSKKVARAFPGNVFIQYFNGDTVKTGEEGEDDNAVPKVNVDRTESLDTLGDRFQTGRIVLPNWKKCEGKTQANYEILRTHCQNLVKKLVERPNGKQEIVYAAKIANHFGMALNSLSIAAFDLQTNHINYSNRFRDQNFY